MQKIVKTLAIVGTASIALSGCAGKLDFVDSLRMLNPFADKLTFVNPPENDILHPYLKVYIQPDSPNNPLLSPLHDSFAQASDGEGNYFKSVSLETPPSADQLEVKSVVIEASTPTSSVNDARTVEERMRCPQKNGKLINTCSSDEASYYKVSCTIRTASSTGSINIVDIASNQSILQKQSSQKASSKVCSDDHGSQLESANSLKQKTYNAIEKELVSDLLPQFVERPSDLVDDIEGLPSSDLQLFEQSLSSATNENLIQARDIYQDLATRYPSNTNILFNAGLIEQATGNFGKAKEYYSQSISLPEAPEDAADYLVEVDEFINKGFTRLKKI